MALHTLYIKDARWGILFFVERTLREGLSTLRSLYKKSDKESVARCFLNFR